MRRAAAALIAVVAVSAAIASSASPSAFLRVGIFDDGQVLYGVPEEVFPLMRATRTKVVRVNLWWHGPSISVAKRKPRRAADPADPAYDWETYDRTARFAAENGIEPVFSIIGTPPWANQARGWNVAPAKIADLRAFAVAAAKRYSGTFRGPNGFVLPRVRRWLAWNEPNNPVFMKPQYKRRAGGGWDIQSAKDYAKICNAIVGGVKSANPGAKVACGVTAPRGNNNPNSSRPSVSPIVFARAVRAAGAKGFDAYAHHPYYGTPAETPSTKPPPGPRGQPPTAVTLGNFDVLVAEVTKLWIQAILDHRVRLSDQPDRHLLRRPVDQAGDLPAGGGRDRAEAPPHRPVPVVPARRRGPDRGMAVRSCDGRRLPQAQLPGVPEGGGLGEQDLEDVRGAPSAVA